MKQAEYVAMVRERRAKITEAVVSMRARGMTFRQIGIELGMTGARAGVIYKRATTNHAKVEKPSRHIYPLDDRR